MTEPPTSPQSLPGITQASWQRLSQGLRDIFTLHAREQVVLAVIGGLLLLGLMIRLALRFLA